MIYNKKYLFFLLLLFFCTCGRFKVSNFEPTNPDSNFLDHPINLSMYGYSKSEIMILIDSEEYDGMFNDEPMEFAVFRRASYPNTNEYILVGTTYETSFIDNCGPNLQPYYYKAALRFINNEFSLPSDAVFGINQDSYEPDEEYTSATYISTNSNVQRHSLSHYDDFDWFRFNALKDKSYKIHIYKEKKWEEILCVLKDSSQVVMGGYIDWFIHNNSSHYTYNFSCTNTDTYYLRVTVYYLQLRSINYYEIAINEQ